MLQSISFQTTIQLLNQVCHIQYLGKDLNVDTAVAEEKEIDDDLPPFFCSMSNEVFEIKLLVVSVVRPPVKGHVTRVKGVRNR